MLESAPLQLRGHSDLVRLGLIGATAPALDRALLREHQVARGLRVQGQCGAAGDVQHHHILPGHCADAHLIACAALRPDPHRLLENAMQ